MKILGCKKFSHFCLGLFLAFIFLFSGNFVSATEIIYFSEDFRTNYSIGDTETVIENNSSNYPYLNILSPTALIKNYYGFIGLSCNSGTGASFEYISPVTIFDKNQNDSYKFKFNVKATSIVNEPQYFKINHNSRLTDPQTSGIEISFKFSLIDNQILIRLIDQTPATQIYTYNTSGSDLFNIEIEYNSLGLVSVFINNSEVVNDVLIYGTWNDVSYIRLSAPNYTEDRYFIFNDFQLLSGASEPSYYWSDWCGTDSGQFLTTTPTNLCNTGSAGTVSFDGLSWTWDCIDGVVSQSCKAYLATSQVVNGTCGAWDGEDFDVWPPNTSLCELQSSLIIPSMVETVNGWTWTCAGFNGGTSDYCTATKTTPVNFPTLPAGSLEDCSGLSTLESLICNIGNSLKQIFSPSNEKIEELNQTINKMSSKFPFSYISTAKETMKNISNNINERSTLELSILGGEIKSFDYSQINFISYIKNFISVFIILAFLFWLIRFIRYIF